MAPCFVAVACAAAAPARYTEPPPGAAGRLAVLGDTQRTLLLERLVFREQNDAERAAIVRDLAAQRPGLLALLGDMTNDGGSRSAWEAFDALFAPVREAGIPVLVALGNHDYWGGAGGALRNAAARFPNIARGRWTARAWGKVRLVFLDSNEDVLGPGAWSEQRAWLGRTLGEIDADPAAAGALLFAHHPPFTNSRTTGDEAHVQRAFLPAFFASKKALAFISGHAHAYERFEERGRAFIVSGGGGGPRVRLLEGAARRHVDQVPLGSPRPFHYLLLEQDDRGVNATVRGLDKGEPEARAIDSFALPFRTP